MSRTHLRLQIAMAAATAAWLLAVLTLGIRPHSSLCRGRRPTAPLTNEEFERLLENAARYGIEIKLPEHV
jgi:hypothetical protein